MRQTPAAKNLKRRRQFVSQRLCNLLAAWDSLRDEFQYRYDSKQPDEVYRSQSEAKELLERYTDLLV